MRESGELREVKRCGVALDGVGDAEHFLEKFGILGVRFGSNQVLLGPIQPFFGFRQKRSDDFFAIEVHVFIRGGPRPRLLPYQKLLCGHVFRRFPAPRSGCPRFSTSEWRRSRSLRRDCRDIGRHSETTPLRQRFLLSCFPDGSRSPSSSPATLPLRGLRNGATPVRRSERLAGGNDSSLRPNAWRRTNKSTRKIREWS